jgi:peptide/nickel transport system substrate-binding protein
MLKKPKPRLLMMSFSIVAVLTFLLSACGASGTPTTTPGSSSGTPVKGGTWIDDIPNEPGSLIPNSDSQTFDVVVEQSLYSPLFVGTYDGKISLGAASEMPTVANGDASADGKTWTIKMKPNLKWSDGQPYNAQDVDFTWKLWTNPKFTAASTVGYNLITSADVSSDNLSITFHLKQPYAPFLALWTDGGGAPLPKHHFASVAPDAIARSADSLNPSVTSGPFKMSESVHGDHYTVVRNDNYYRASEGLPYLDKIIYRPIASEDTILKDLQAGSITSSWFLDVSKTPVYKSLASYKVAVNPDASNFEVMIINLKNPILGKNLEVRQAMSMAIDKNTLIKTARLGEAAPLCTDHGASLHPGYQPDAACPKFDPAAANTLLDQHGWVKGADGIRSKNGQRLEFTYSTTTGKPWRAADEAIIQSNFKDIGIKMNIQNYPASTFFGTFMPGGKHDLAEFENSYTYDPDDASLLDCSQQGQNGENWSFYCSQQMETYIHQEQSSADPNVRQQAFNQIHNLELTDIPFVVLYSPLDLGIAKSTAHNYAPGPEGASETVNVWQWWCTNGTC